MRTVDNLTIFICRLSWNLGGSTCWNHQGLSRPVMELLYLTDLTKLFELNFSWPFCQTRFDSGIWGLRCRDRLKSQSTGVTDVLVPKVAEWHILKMEAADVSETSVPICLTTWHHTPEGNAGSVCCRSGSSISLPYSALRSLVTVMTKRGKLFKFNFVFDYTTRKPRKASKRQANKCLFVQTIVLCCSQWCFPLKSFVLL